jgi:glycosyltransferase involved in cell wall biosynthesis
VLETGTASQPERRLPGVAYFEHPLDRSRWLKTRFHPYAMAWFSHRASKASFSLNGAEFDGVLTVAHGFGWLPAANLAQKRNAPLHLMVHDDWPRAANVPPGFRNWIDNRFGDVYRQAQSRLCVSPAMQRAYETRYGASAEVVYPSRASNLPEFAEPPQRLAHNDHQFTIAFAGTINSPGYVKALIALHDALAAAGGRLLIFGPLTSEQARQVGLDLPNVVVGGLLSWPELMRRLREEVDALFVPMSFDVSDSSNMQMAFPSKLADCTAVGLPLLVYGPPYCSAVHWARENAGVAEVVEAEAGLAEVVLRLVSDSARRVELGKEALRVGREYFACDAVRAVFNRAINRG